MVWLQGDQYDRGAVVLDCFKKGFAPRIILSGNNILLGADVRPGEDNISLQQMESWLLKRGVPQEAIVIEDQSMNTHDQGIHLCSMAKERGWETLMVVGSLPHYQARYYLTFLHAQKETGWQGRIIPAAVKISLTDIPGGRDMPAATLMEAEEAKIGLYQAKGHVATFEEGFRALAEIDRIHAAVTETEDTI
jgi:hypothetical protein